MVLQAVQYLLFSLVINGLLALSAVAQEEQVPTTHHSLSKQVGFVSNQTCVSCHQQEAGAWQGSHHQRAMLPATANNVLGDFNDVRFTDAGVTSHFFKKGEKFFVNTPGADGIATDFEVKYTFGTEPLQQYLLSLPKGKLQAFTVAWDVQKQRWFDLYPNEKVEVSDPAHWTSRAFTANSSCMECHTTDMSLNHDAESGVYETQWSEVNVSCQSCHGPGEKHLQWVNQQEKGSNTGTAKNDIAHKGLAVNYPGLSSHQQVETCARCHSRRYSVSQNDAHGRSLYDDFMPELLRQGVYHADGQVLEEDYVFGSFIQSKMHQRGVTCMNCHEPHSLKLRKEGNALCTTCHQQAAPPKAEFASLKSANYDSSAHHFHQEQSEGAQCVNCHMPATTYMQIDPRRDHSFSIPRPDVSEQWNIPNACNGCHSDQSATWATKAMNQWYGGEQWQQRPTIAATLSKGRAGLAEAYQPLQEMINDQAQPAIIRATAVHLLSRYGEKAHKTLLAQLASDSPLIRATALHGVSGIPAQHKAAAIIPLLKDSVQGVRVAAANALLNVPGSFMNTEEKTAFEHVLKEYQGAQLAQSDHPEGHFNLGNMHAIQGDLKAAEKAYRIAIKQDARFLPAYNNLAHLYYQTGRGKDAESSFREAIQHVPNNGNLYYSLALLLTEQKRLEEALPLLAKAAELSPQDVRTHYNYGLLLQRLNKIPQAEISLDKALSLAPDNRRVRQALAALYQQQGNMEKLKALTERSSTR